MATYYVRSSGGNDGNDGLSFANGWATVQFAADTAVAGDVVLICADGTHAPGATVDFDINAGGIFRGAAADGTDDGTVATISGAGFTGDLIHLNHASGIHEFHNLRLTAVDGDAVHVDDGYSSDGSIPYLFLNVEIDTITGTGIYTSDFYASCLLIDCEIRDCGVDGMGQENASRGITSLVRCTIHDNVRYGVATESFRASDSMIYDNGNVGVLVSGTSTYFNVYVENSTFWGNSGTGLDIASGPSHIAVSNSIFRNNGGYGIDVNGAVVSNCSAFKNICSHNNTSGHIDINSGTLPGSGHVLEDPQFASETDGSEDFTPANTNLKITSAFPAGGTTYAYIGAIEPNDAGGGGGGLAASPLGSLIVRRAA